MTYRTSQYVFEFSCVDNCKVEGSDSENDDRRGYVVQVPMVPGEQNLHVPWVLMCTRLHGEALGT